MARRASEPPLLTGDDGTPGKDTAPESLARRLGLTPAEARLTAALVAGNTLKGYSASAGLSLHTVRNQLKQVFLKTKTHRQAELLRLVLIGPEQNRDS